MSVDLSEMPPSPFADESWQIEQTLKDPDIEEWINQRVHRPLAFYLILKPIERLPKRLRPSPNQLTFCSGATGVGAAIAATQAPEHGAIWLVLSAFLLFVSVLFDCSDGMLARLSKTSSRFGMLLDGAMDFVVGASFWAAMVWATMPTWLGRWGWPCAVVILLSFVLHCALYDHFRNRFVQVSNPPDASLDNSDDVDGSMGLVERLYQMAYVTPSRMLVGVGPGDPRPNVSAEVGRRILKRPMNMASWMGLGTQLAMMYLATALAFISPQLPFYAATVLVVVGLNLWMLLTIIIWRRAEKTLQKEAA